MSTASGFHEVRFPSDVALGASGGPVRRNEIISLGSGFEHRNAKWQDAKRRYDAGFGIRTVDDLHDVIGFFEERQGSLYGFRFHDPVDWKSCKPSITVSDIDQLIATGDGTTTVFQLIKIYGGGVAPYVRTVSKPVAGSVQVAVDGQPGVVGTDFTIDHTCGEVTFLPSAIPGAGAQITAGYEFDVPVRFDLDQLTVNLNAFEAGEIPSIPLVEVRI